MGYRRQSALEYGGAEFFVECQSDAGGTVVPAFGKRYLVGKAGHSDVSQFADTRPSTFQIRHLERWGELLWWQGRIPKAHRNAHCRVQCVGICGALPDDGWADAVVVGYCPAEKQAAGGERVREYSALHESVDGVPADGRRRPLGHRCATGPRIC